MTTHARSYMYNAINLYSVTPIKPMVWLTPQKNQENEYGKNNYCAAVQCYLFHSHYKQSVLIYNMREYLENV